VAQIFISHSQLDNDLKNFFAKIFSSTKVKAIWEEYEKIINQQEITSEKINEDIRISNAVFITLSQNIENIRHTRDWINWESGVASANNKDIWVFEPFEQLGKITVPIPHLCHYVIFEINASWLNYIYRIITSYDDSNILSTTASKLKEITTLNGLVGDIVDDRLNYRPKGIQIKCIHCSSIYNIHYPFPANGMNRFYFRCPVCNANLLLQL
jgi:hypothetical protein